MQLLSENKIKKSLSEMNDWRLEGNVIKRDWEFRDFSEAMDFINMIAVIAEKHNHHPYLENTYNRVSLSFNTHDAGGITEKDINIAREIDRL